MSSTPTPDLASILATLASLNKNQNKSQEQQQVSQVSAPSTYTPPPSEQPQLQYPPQQQFHFPSQPIVQTPTQWPPAASAPQVAQKPVVDPATITEWSAGLRCVMKTVSKHDQLLNEIRKMIKVQHEHEEQWWKGREDLVKRQNARADGQKKLDEMLKNLGGKVSEGNSNTTPEELASELKTFDMKVHRAQMQMVKEMSARLRNLGIPFFGTRNDLVIPFGKGEVVEGDGGKKLEKGMIHEVDLVKLQRKMLGILEDMCNE